MKQIKRILLTLAILSAWSSYAFAEFVFVKSGQVIEGKIVEDRARSIIVLKSDKTRVEVKRGDVLRINYTQMYTGKFSIMKVNEQVFDAFIVDEDQSSVTFRTEWDKPVEFTLSRDSILFMTKKNPTSLQCKVIDDSVRLNWNAPFMKVDFYNVYYREKGGEFVKAGDTSGKGFTMDDLTRDAVYEFYVTAVDEEGYESLPSKEVRVYINPMKLVHEKEYTDAGDFYTLKLTWEPLIFKGKAVTKYDIYKKSKDVFMLVGSTSDNGYAVAGLSSEEENLVEVRPVIGKDEFLEGNNVQIPRLFYNEQIVFSVHGAWLMPLKEFKDVTDPGYGAVAEIMMQNYYFKRLSFGVQCGYYRFPGIEGVPNVNEDITEFSMIPFMLGLRYGYSPIRSLYISAGVFGGYSYNSIGYNKQFFESGEFVAREVKESSFEPIVSAGLQIQWQVWEGLMLKAGADYSLILENKVNYPFASFYAGAGYAF